MRDGFGTMYGHPDTADSANLRRVYEGRLGRFHEAELVRLAVERWFDPAS
jgi:hypothetical protein